MYMYNVSNTQVAYCTAGNIGRKWIFVVSTCICQNKTHSILFHSSTHAQ